MTSFTELLSTLKEQEVPFAFFLRSPNKHLTNHRKTNIAKHTMAQDRPLNVGIIGYGFVTPPSLPSPPLPLQPQS